MRVHLSCLKIGVARTGGNCLKSPIKIMSSPPKLALKLPVICLSLESICDNNSAPIMLTSSIIKTLTNLNNALYCCATSIDNGSKFDYVIFKAVSTVVPSIATAAFPVDAQVIYALQ